MDVHRLGGMPLGGSSSRWTAMFTRRISASANTSVGSRGHAGIVALIAPTPEFEFGHDNIMKYTIHYTLRADGPEGEVIEATVPESPFTFEAGAEEILEDLEAAVTGAAVGDQFELVNSADKAHGPEMEGAFAVLPKTQFVDEEGMDDPVMAEGEVVVMRDETGEELHGVVIGVSEEEVEVDFNHPACGTDLHFSVQVMATGASKG